MAVIRNYEPLMVLLGQDGAAGDPVAIGLNQQLSSYKYVALLHLVADILDTVNRLSRLFQYRDISFSALHEQDCLDTLDGMRQQNGPCLTSSFQGADATDNVFKGVTLKVTGHRGEGDQVDVFGQWRELLLTTLHKNIQNRFPQVEILEAMQIFEPKAYPEPNRLVGWGNEKLEIRLDHYGKPHTNTAGRRFDRLVDPDTTRGEFLPFKRLVNRHRDDNGPRSTELMKLLFKSVDGNKLVYPEMFKLMSMSLCVLIRQRRSREDILHPK